MLARATRTSAAAAAQQLVARRAFTTTRARLSSPYHYPEGPLSNIPFNPRKKGFALGYWSYCVVGFFLPFGIAGTYNLHVQSFLSFSTLSVCARRVWRLGVG
jgi:cytochrome c oxidase subunit 7c